MSVCVCMSLCLCVCACVCVCNPWNHRDPFGLFSLLEFLSFLAGGARDAHWTGTNEDASAASVKSIRDAGLTYLLGEKPT